MNPEHIGDLVNEKDVKCPQCGGEMKKTPSKNPKTKFKCKNCGDLFDFAVVNEMQSKGLEGFLVDEYHLNLKGYCKICRP